MARVFKRRDRLSAMSEINLTSLMDLVFCLLIIFMITTPLLEQTNRVDLPTQPQNARNTIDPKLKYQPVTIDRQGRLYWGDQEVNLDELSQRFKTVAAQPDPPVINFRADGEQTYQKVMDVVNCAEQAGIVNWSFDTQAK